MERGTVSWFDPVKGFGFIIPDVPHQGKKDFFVHKSSVETLDQTLEKGDRVEFEIGEGAKGPEAKSVRLIEE
jgi:CspA family cold shock protein